MAEFKTRQEYERWKAERIKKLTEEKALQQAGNAIQTSDETKVTTQQEVPNPLNAILNDQGPTQNTQSYLRLCASCGKSVNEFAANTDVCLECSKIMTGKFSDKEFSKAVGESSQDTIKEFAGVAKESSYNAVRAFKTLIFNPIGGISEAFEKLGPKRAMAVGIVFGIVFDLCIIIGVYMILRKISGMFGMMPHPKSSFMPAPSQSTRTPSFDLVQLFKLLLIGAVPFVSIAVSSAIARVALRGKGGVQSDLFLAGASLLPIGLFILLSGILGIGNIEVISILFVYSLCFTVLLLYSGCTKISGISEAASAFAVPGMLLLSIWLSKIIFTSII